MRTRNATYQHHFHYADEAGIDVDRQLSRSQR